MFVPDPCQDTRWITSSNRVNAAAARPVLMPMKQTASQNRSAPGLASVVGIFPLFFARGAGIEILLTNAFRFTADR
jgi:hypothetical protein